MLISLLASQFGQGFTGVGTGAFDAGVGGVNAGVSLDNTITLIVSFLTVVAGLAFMLYFIFAGLQWTLAGGDSGKVDSAKKQMTNGAIGLIVIVLSYGIIAVVGEVLGLNILNPSDAILELNTGKSGQTGNTTP